MSDALFPPPDPDEVERDEDPLSAERAADEPAVAGVGPALLTPPLPSPPPEPNDEVGANDDSDD